MISTGCRVRLPADCKGYYSGKTPWRRAEQQGHSRRVSKCLRESWEEDTKR
jgi:hypothetical protein